MKRKLWILSDIDTKINEKWIKNYINLLNTDFDVSYFNIRDLAGISLDKADIDAVHQDFIKFGIDEALSSLLSQNTNPNVLLGFSLGGTIVWKYALKTNIPYLFAISSTRLRYENQVPDSEVYLEFGELDAYKPTSEWFENKVLNFNIRANSGHEFYKEIDYIKELSKKIKLIRF